MTYLTLHIETDTPEARRIEALATAEHIAPEAAALKLLNESSLARPSKATPEAMAILGAGRDDAELIDDILELIHSDKACQDAEPLRV